MDLVKVGSGVPVPNAASDDELGVGVEHVDEAAMGEAMSSGTVQCDGAPAEEDLPDGVVELHVRKVGPGGGRRREGFTGLQNFESGLA